MLRRHPRNPVVAPDPRHAWESVSAFNAGVQPDPAGGFHMLYRATNRARFWDEPDYTSVIGYAHSADGVRWHRETRPVLVGDSADDRGLGCEDPRLMRIDGVWVCLYTAVAGRFGRQRIRIAAATTTDFRRWQKHGVVGPDTTSKAAALIPGTGGGLWMLYTLAADSPASTVLAARFRSLDQLLSGDRRPVAASLMRFDESAVLRPRPNVWRGPELGAVPVAVEDGWLFIHCPQTSGDRDEWTIAAALLDRDDPRRVLATTGDLLRPELAGERPGVMPNVCFPSAAVVRGDDLYVYYGAGDESVHLATCPVGELLDALRRRATPAGAA